MKTSHLTIVVGLVVMTICFSVAGDCEEDEFRCPSGMCIPPDWKCDGDVDCLDDGADNDEGVTAGCSPSNNPCDSGKFSCNDGNCIHENWRCDGDPDCDDESDEAGCSV